LRFNKKNSRKGETTGEKEKCKTRHQQKAAWTQTWGEKKKQKLCSTGEIKKKRCPGHKRSGREKKKNRKGDFSWGTDNRMCHKRQREGKKRMNAQHPTEKRSVKPLPEIKKGAKENNPSGRRKKEENSELTNKG